MEYERQAAEDKHIAALQEQALQYEAQMRDMKNVHKQVWPWLNRHKIEDCRNWRICVNHI